VKEGGPTTPATACKPPRLALAKEFRINLRKQEALMADTPKDGEISWITTIGSLVGTTSAISILLSVLYDYGFYRLGVGIPITAIPTAMSDHIKACFMWLPIALLMLTTLFITILALNYKDKSKGEKRTLNAIPDNTGKVKFNNPKRVSAVLVVLALITAIAIFILKAPNQYLMFSLVGLTIYILQYISNAIAEKFINMGRFSSPVHIFSLAAPTIVGFFVMFGYLNARNEIQSKIFQYEIILKDVSAPKIRGNVLRSYDKVTFFVYSTQKLVFMQNDQIKMITKK
jgi:hypothetical protein